MFDIVIFININISIVNNSLFQISIDDSKVPSIKYEISAMLDLKKAFQLFPYNEDSRMESFLELYAEDFKDTVWSVADGCTYLYLPEDHLSVRLKVVNGSDIEYVKIFGTINKNSTLIGPITVG